MLVLLPVDIAANIEFASATTTAATVSSTDADYMLL